MIRYNGFGRIPLLLTVLSAASGGCSDRGSSQVTFAGVSQRSVASIGSVIAGSSGKHVPTLAKPGVRNPSAATKPDGAAFVAGQLVVKFKSSGGFGVTDDVGTCLSQGRSFASATADNSSSLDLAMKRHGIFRAASLVRGREGLATRAAQTRLRTSAKRIAAARARSRVAPVDELVNVYRLDLPASADLGKVMQDLRNDPHVEYVHPNYIAKLAYTPNDPYWASSNAWGQTRSDLWDQKQIHADQAWDWTRGSGVVVAVVDTGVDITHPDLAGNVWTNSAEIPDNGVDDDGNGYIDDVHGWNVLYGNGLIDDSVGHGTHVAGTIAAQDNNSVGVVGVAPDARIMPVLVFANRTATDVFQLSQGLLYAAQNGADVINNSWGTCNDYCPTVGVLEDAVRTAHAAGSVVVFAAGNESINVRNISPNNQPEAIVVTATTPSDALAPFSNFGLVDVGAPGSGEPDDPMAEPTFGILSLSAANCDPASFCTQELLVGDAYARFAGTSMAAPHVSGLAALILSLHPDYTPEQVRQVLRRTSLDANGNGYDSELGYGRVDASQIAAESTPLEALIQLPLFVQTPRVAVQGRANGDQFQRYVLEYGSGAAPATWTTVVDSTSEVYSGTLGNWDASQLPDGDYTLRLTAYKNDGERYEDRHLLTLDRVAITWPEPAGIVRDGDIAITGVAAPGTFQSYTVRVQTLETGASVPADLVLTNGGTQPVANGVLAVWHAQNVRAGHYRIILDITNTDGSITSENVIFIVDSMVHQGWPVELSYTNRYSMMPTEPVTLADLDQDGKSEVIAGWGEKVTVLKGDGSPLPGWPQSFVTPDDIATSLKEMPVVGDVDGDGLNEVVAVTATGYIFVWGANGAIKPGWPLRVPTGDGVSASLSLADLDKNGALDIIATEAQTGIYVFTGNGGTLPGWPALLGAGIKGPATVADLDGDGNTEVAAGIDVIPARLVVLNARGVFMPGWPQTLKTAGYDPAGSYPVAGDLDGDGDLEIVAVTSDALDATLSRVVIYHHDGQLLSSWATNATTMQPPVLADVDGDGSLEILSSLVRSDGTGEFFVWDRNGTVLPGWPRSSASYSSSTTMAFNAPIVLDLDGDGRNEIVTSRLQEYWSDELSHRYGYPVQAFQSDGTPITSMSRPAYGSWDAPDASPGVADLDGDGRLELVWTETYDLWRNAERPWPRVFVWDLTGFASVTPPWPMYRADARHSGVAQAVSPFVRITQRNVPRRVNGTGRFLVHSGGGGVIQIKHPWRAVVKYAVGSNPLKQTTLGWGEQFSVPRNQDINLTIVTTSPMDVTIDWW